MTMIKPLTGLKVLEFDAIGPVPFCAMMLADHGAQITRITRPGGQPNGVDAGGADLMLRGRSDTLELDLKAKGSPDKILSMLSEYDVLIEGHRPGVMERLGLSPQLCLEANPALVYCRITGYGQTGPLARNPGHDINYIAQTGALEACGPADLPPPPPLSLIGDFGGGGMMGAFGIVAAVLSARSTGKGMVIDTAMVDGTAMMMAMTYGWQNAGIWSPTRDSNILDGAAPFYRCYRAGNGQFVAAGALEPKFYHVLCEVLHLTDPIFQDQLNKANWPRMRELIADAIAGMPAEQLQAAIDTPDACLSWVVPMAELGSDGHMQARGMITREGDQIALGTAPKFHSGT